MYLNMGISCVWHMAHLACMGEFTSEEKLSKATSQQAAELGPRG